MAFNVAQGFKDIANKFINGLPLENGGTGATISTQGWSNLSNNANSFALATEAVTDEWFGTEINYFLPFPEDYFSIQVERGDLSFNTKTVSWNDISGSTFGIEVSSTASSGYYLVSGNIRYVASNTSGALQTAIVRKRGTSYTNISWITGTYGADERISHSFSQIVYLQPGDFIFFGCYKSTTFYPQMVEGISQRFCVLKLL